MWFIFQTLTNFEAHWVLKIDREKYRSSEDILANRVLTTKYNGNQCPGNSPTDGENQVCLKGYSIKVQSWHEKKVFR